jgi:hypothetical protein
VSQEQDRVVKLTYFKKSGKWYGEASFRVSEEMDIYQVARKVREMNSRGGLPGLTAPGSWDEAIVLEYRGLKHAVYPISDTSTKTMLEEPTMDEAKKEEAVFQNIRFKRLIRDLRREVPSPDPVYWRGIPMSEMHKDDVLRVIRGAVRERDQRVDMPTTKEALKDAGIEAPCLAPTSQIIAEELRLIGDECLRAMCSHGRFHSPHEGFAVIHEEFDELKAEVWKRSFDKAAARKEATHLGAMALRFLTDCCE